MGTEQGQVLCAKRDTQLSPKVMLMQAGWEVAVVLEGVQRGQVSLNHFHQGLIGLGDLVLLLRVGHTPTYTDLFSQALNTFLCSHLIGLFSWQSALMSPDITPSLSDWLKTFLPFSIQTRS